MEKNEEKVLDNQEKKGIDFSQIMKEIDVKKIGSDVGEKFMSLKDKTVQKFDKLKQAELEKNKDIEEQNEMDEIEDTLEENTGKVKINEKLQEAIIKYNLVYTQFSDRGLSLFRQRERAVDLILFVEQLINSIANHPKSFDTDIAAIQVDRQYFTTVSEYTAKELRVAQNSAMGAGAGVAAGAAVVSLAPSAAMWVATTFGTASTGTAISSLSGAAATKAALAWLGGGALSAGGGGIAAGNALLALAGPIGWSVAGVSLLASIVLLTSKKMKYKEEKIKEIEDIKRNTVSISELDAKLEQICNKTTLLREELNKQYSRCMKNYGKNYLWIPSEEKVLLGILVNNTKALAALLREGVE